MSKFIKGYKGTGMCSHCINANIQTHGSGREYLACAYYLSSCKQVSRNCNGIKAVRDVPIKIKAKWKMKIKHS